MTKKKKKQDTLSERITKAFINAGLPTPRIKEPSNYQKVIILNQKKLGNYS